MGASYLSVLSIAGACTPVSSDLYFLATAGVWRPLPTWLVFPPTYNEVSMNHITPTSGLQRIYEVSMDSRYKGQVIQNRTLLQPYRAHTTNSPPTHWAGTSTGSDSSHTTVNPIMAPLTLHLPRECRIVIWCPDGWDPFQRQFIPITASGG